MAPSFCEIDENKCFTGEFNTARKHNYVTLLVAAEAVTDKFTAKFFTGEETYVTPLVTAGAGWRYRRTNKRTDRQTNRRTSIAVA